MFTDIKTKLPTAGPERIRVDVTLIPAEPLYSAVINASQAISRQFTNQNIIDNDTFPPHASLHICTIPKDQLSIFLDMIDHIVEKSLPELVPVEVIKGSAGYISLGLTITPAIRSLHERILSAAATVRGADYQEDPVRLARLPPADRQIFQKYGSSFVLERFDLHISIAKVVPEHQARAWKIATQVLGTITSIPTSSVQVCDIGMCSEKWIVLHNIEKQ